MMKTPTYVRPPLRFLHVAELMDHSPEAMARRKLRAIAASAQALGDISATFPTRRLKQAARSLIADKLPYCLRREGDLWFLNDREYTPMSRIGLTEDEVVSLGIPKWNRRQVHDEVWQGGDFPIVSDRLRADWFAGAANLIQDIVHLLEKKNMKGQDQ